MRHIRLGSLAVLWISMIGWWPTISLAAQSPDELETFSTLTHMIRWGGVLASVATVFSAWLLLHFVESLVEKLGGMFAERRLLFQKLSAFFHFFIYITTIVVVTLMSFKISKEVLAIIGGTAAVAMGFALKDLVASIVAGGMIMIDRPFQVGDRVSFGGQYGDITTIGLRSVKLQTMDDNTVTIPNNMFLNQITSCGNYGNLDMQVVVDFHIGIDQDIKVAKAIVREASATSRYVYLPKPVVVRVSQVVIDPYVAVRLRLKIYVLDIKFEAALISDITERVLEAFEASKIKPPAIIHRNAIDRRDIAKSQAVSIATQGH
ncbi:MAG: mechanosensitive ion channel domain-containing protein [Thermodesulfobacteriota bacterium]